MTCTLYALCCIVVVVCMGPNSRSIVLLAEKPAGIKAQVFVQNHKNSSHKTTANCCLLTWLHYLVSDFCTREAKGVGARGGGERWCQGFDKALQEESIYLASRVYSQGCKLHRVGGCQGAEVAVSDQVKGPHCAIQAGTYDDTPTGQESDCSHWAGVL